MLFKLATPWCHRVTFPLFFIADILTSLSGPLVDFVAVLTLGTAPGAVYFIVSSIPTVIRAIQCIVKYRERRQVNPHLWNFGKYAISVFGNLSNFKQIYNTKWGFIAINCIKSLEIVYKTYWDVF